MSYRWLLLPLLLSLLLATLPLRQVISWSGADRWLAASGAEGTIWRGVLRQARLGSMALGDVRLALDPLSLIGGRIGFHFTADGVLAGTGMVVSHGDAALRAGELRFPIEALAAGLPLRGDMRLSNLDIAFRNGGCSRAQGAAVVEQARLEQADVRLTPDTALRGVWGCAGGDAVLRLSGRSGGAEIHGVLRVAADGAWRLESRVMGLDQGGNALAAMAGFRAEADGYARIDQGRLAL